MALLKKLARVLWISALLSLALADVPDESDFSQGAIDSGEALAQLSQLAQDAADDANVVSKRNAPRSGSSCTPSQIRVRKEWRTLSVNERKAYISAVKCLQATPSLLDPTIFPGSVSLFDDFIAIHLLQTGTIHFTGTFLTWHRYYIWAYEQKLRSVCSYQGPLPYWEWGLDVNNPAASPIFDGSVTSLGGNGAFFPHPGILLALPGLPDPIALPPGTGGGCVTSGPFANMTVHLGPVAVPQYGSTNSTGVPNPLADNPRCLKRDLNAGVAKRWTSFRNTTSLILQTHNIEQFQAVMQADPRYISGEIGVHGGGHYTMGGDPGSDPFISPGDPAFYLHHGQIDRVYWIWQLLDFPHRQNVFGTNTLLDFPPSANTTVEDYIDISPLAPPVKIKDLMNTVGGSPLCYIYL